MQTRDLWFRKRKMRLMGCIMLFAPLAIFSRSWTLVAQQKKSGKVDFADAFYRN